MENQSELVWGMFTRSISRSLKQQPHDLYEVDALTWVAGEAPAIEQGSPLWRFETSRVEVVVSELGNHHSWVGATQHLHYTNAAQRRMLDEYSRGPLAAGPDTLAVLIPVRKHGVWWRLPEDERRRHFGEQGHTTIGLRYARAIYRRLYHCRYLPSGTTYDFLTYFEFERERADEFRRLLDELRDQKKNPEWSFVETEFEIWLTKRQTRRGSTRDHRE